MSVSNLHVAKTGCLTLPEASLLGINTIELLSLSENSKQIFFDDHTFLGTYNIEKFSEISQDFEDIINNNIKKDIKDKHKAILQSYIKKYFFKYDGKRCFEYSKVLDAYLKNKSNFLKKNRFIKFIKVFICNIIKSN